MTCRSVFLTAVLFLAMAARVATQPPPPPGPCCWPPPCTCSCLTPPLHLVGWWTLDESGTTYYDRALGATGMGFHVTPLPGGINGGAARFDGATSYISVANRPALNFGSGDFSIDLWVPSRPL